MPQLLRLITDGTRSENRTRRSSCVLRADDGSCAGGKANDCDDANPCTADTCDAFTQQCKHDDLDGSPCADGDKCKPGAVCVAGTCDVDGGVVGTAVGTSGVGAKDGPFATAVLSEPAGLAVVVEAGKPVVYLADVGARTIRKLDPATQTVTTIAGSGSWGSSDGPALTASFASPRAVAVGDDGALYIADEGNDAIRKLKDGVVSTVAGWQDGIDGPRDLVLDASGSLFVANAGKHQVVRLDAIATFDATGSDALLITGSDIGFSGSKDGQGDQASFSSPAGLCFGGGRRPVRRGPGQPPHPAGDDGWRRDDAGGQLPRVR